MAGLISVLVVWVLSFAPSLQSASYAGDGAQYISLAQGLLEKRDLVASQVVDTPKVDYQPLLPLLLSAIIYLFPDFPHNLSPLVIGAGILPGILSVWLIWQYLQTITQLSDSEHLLVILLFALSYTVLPFFTNHVMTEALYLAVSLAAILSLNRYCNTSHTLDFWLFVTAFFLAASYYTRAVGVTLIAASVGYLLFSTRRVGKALWLGGATALFLLPWIIRNRSLESSMLGGRYSDLLMRESYWTAADQRIDSIWMLAPRALQNAYIHAVESLPQLMVPWLRHPDLLRSEWSGVAAGFAVVVGAFFFGLLLLGFFASLRHSFDVVHGYFLLYAGMIVITPWITVRNWVPVLPFLLTWIVLGSATLGNWIATRWPRMRLSRNAVVLAVASLILISNLARDVGHLRRGAEFRAQGIPWTRSERALADASAWIRAHTEPDELVFHIQPQMLYLFTDRQTTPLLASNDPIQISTLEADVVMQELYHNFAYVLRDSSKDLIPGLAAAIAGQDSRLEAVYETGGEPMITIFRIVAQTE